MLKKKKMGGKTKTLCDQKNQLLLKTEEQNVRDKFKGTKVSTGF